MAEIIHVDFKNKRLLKGKGNQPDNIKPIDEIKTIKVEGGDVYLNFLKFKLLDGAKVLFNLDVSPNSLHQSREIVKSYSTAELMDWLEKTNENDWKKKAAFYQAIFEELDSRLKKFL